MEEKPKTVEMAQGRRENTKTPVKMIVLQLVAIEAAGNSRHSSCWERRGGN
jgi:hypothetical protein